MRGLALLAEHLPLEQGLRLWFSSYALVSLPQLAEHLPLEQGLRPSSGEPRGPDLLLAEHLPLEQGLRLNKRIAIFSYHKARRASSIRTRIKTE